MINALKMFKDMENKLFQYFLFRTEYNGRFISWWKLMEKHVVDDAVAWGRICQAGLQLYVKKSSAMCGNRQCWDMLSQMTMNWSQMESTQNGRSKSERELWYFKMFAFLQSFCDGLSKDVVISIAWQNSWPNQKWKSAFSNFPHFMVRYEWPSSRSWQSNKQKQDPWNLWSLISDDFIYRYQGPKNILLYAKWTWIQSGPMDIQAVLCTTCRKVLHRVMNGVCPIFLNCCTSYFINLFGLYSLATCNDKPSISIFCLMHSVHHYLLLQSCLTVYIFIYQYVQIFYTSVKSFLIQSCSLICFS